MNESRVLTIRKFPKDMFQRCFVLLFFLDSSYSSILDWLGLPMGSKSSAVNHIPLIKVPFEELDPEEKFLVEASKITGLKLEELDVCQQKLVQKLKSSCGALSDEELSKLAVGLLNCQSEIEGRKVFPCTPEMTLRECTHDMDPDTWNSYHVISNRARAVCYAVRQDHFRALAEMTVNKLMTASQEHIHKMEEVEDKQMKLGQSTDAVLNQLLRSQTDVLASYGNLKKLESSLISSIAYGVNRVEHQKKLLSEFQKMIGSMMNKFQTDMNSTGSQMSEKLMWYFEQHKSLQKSLIQLDRTAEEIAKKLKESNMALQKRENEIISKTETTINRLHGINESVTNMAAWVEYFEELGRPRFHWIREVVGEKGDRFDLVMLIAIHICCLLSAMLMCSFLSVPLTSRWLLCIAGPINIYLASLTEYQEFSTSLFQFYVTFSIIVVGDYCSRYIYTWYSRNKSPSVSLRSRMTTNQHITNSTPWERNNKFTAGDFPINNGGGDINSKVSAWLSEKYTSQRNGHLFSAPSLTPMKNPNEDNESYVSQENILRREAPTLPPASVAGSHYSSSVRSRCSAICKSGVPCKNSAYGYTSKCRVHSRGPSEHR